MAAHFYIDGYNVIHHCPELRPLVRKDFEAARETFIDRVARYCTATHKRATIVFDGRGRHTTPVPPFRSSPNLSVIYASAHQSADAYIERAVYKTAKRLDIIVVSADRGIRDLCSGLGSLVMDSDNFLQTMDDGMRSARHNIRQRPNPEITRLEHRLDEEGSERLRLLRNTLDE